MSSQSTSSSYYFSSTTNASEGGNVTTGHRYSTASHTDPEGNTIVRTARQELGQPAVVEERVYDRTGQEQKLLEPGEGGSTATGKGQKRIVDLGEVGTTRATTYDGGTQYGSESSSVE